MRQLSKLLFGLVLFGLVQWPLLGQAQKDDPDKPKSEKKAAPKTLAVAPCPSGGLCLKHLDNQKLVFTVNQEGDSSNLTDSLSDVSGDLGLQLRIQTVNWCRQDYKCHDFVDQPAQLKAAVRLAGWTRLIRKDCPNCEIYYVGFSAGARVVLAAAEMLPPKSVNNIFLIAPGVSNTYDLRPALAASRGGIVNFWSSEDDYLERIVEKRGTSEGARGFAAGRVGFRAPPWLDPKGKAAYCGLRQFRWNEDMCGQGGHCAWIIRHNMKRCLVPLFFQPSMVACNVVAPARPPAVKPPPPLPKKLPAAPTARFLPGEAPSSALLPPPLVTAPPALLTPTPVRMPDVIE